MQVSKDDPFDEFKEEHQDQFEENPTSSELDLSPGLPSLTPSKSLPSNLEPALMILSKGSLPGSPDLFSSKALSSVLENQNISSTFDFEPKEFALNKKTVSWVI